MPSVLRTPWSPYDDRLTGSHRRALAFSRATLNHRSMKHVDGVAGVPSSLWEHGPLNSTQRASAGSAWACLRLCS